MIPWIEAMIKHGRGGRGGGGRRASGCVRERRVALAASRGPSRPPAATAGASYVWPHECLPACLFDVPPNVLLISGTYEA